MSTFVEFWKERNIKAMKDIEYILEEKKEMVLFLTEEGLEFEENFHILFVEIFQSSFSGLMDKFNNMQEKIMSIEYIEGEEEKILKNEKLTPDQKAKAVEILSEIKTRLNQVNKIGEEVPRLYAELHFILDIEGIEKKDKEIEEKEEVANLQEKNDLKLNIISRLIGCFVFSLYAYMDIYCMSLFQSIICCCPPEMLFDVYGQLQNATNPIRSVESLLKTISILSGEEEKEILKIVNQRVNSIAEWKERYNSFSTFIKIRNTVAHKQPFLDVDVLKEIFPKITKRIEEEMDENSLKLDDIMTGESVRLSIADDIIQALWENVVNMLYIREIGFESTKYLALIDRLVFGFLDDIKCFEEIEETETSES